jgi:hypothetical protein
MFNFYYFGINLLLECNDDTAFWKCDEKLKETPFFNLLILHLFSKLHVVYLKILQ